MSPLSPPPGSRPGSLLWRFRSCVDPNISSLYGAHERTHISDGLTVMALLLSEMLMKGISTPTLGLPTQWLIRIFFALLLSDRWLRICRTPTRLSTRRGWLFDRTPALKNCRKYTSIIERSARIDWTFSHDSRQRTGLAPEKRNQTSNRIGGQGHCLARVTAAADTAEHLRGCPRG